MSTPRKTPSSRTLRKGTILVALLFASEQFYFWLHEEDHSIIGARKPDHVRDQTIGSRRNLLELGNMFFEMGFKPRIVAVTMEQLKELLGEPFTGGELVAGATVIPVAVVRDEARAQAQALHDAGELLWTEPADSKDASGEA